MKKIDLNSKEIMGKNCVVELSPLTLVYAESFRFKSSLVLVS